MAQTNFMTLKVNLRQNVKNSSNSAYHKYYAEVDSEKTLTTLGLAKHLKDHGCLAGLDAIQAVLAKLAECIPEIVSQGYGVMLDGLGKFYPTLKSKGATEAEMVEEGWQLAQLIKGVRVRFLPTSKQMQNITSKQMLTRCAVESGNLIRAVRDAQTKKKLYDELTPLSKFLGDLRATNAPSNDGGTTDGGTSGGSQAETVASPTISGNTSFSDSTQVSMSGPQGAEIRYTTDGSVPTSASTLYSAPFTLTATTVVKAIAIKNGVSSEVVTLSFTKSNGSGDDAE